MFLMRQCSIKNAFLLCNKTVVIIRGNIDRLSGFPNVGKTNAIKYGIMPQYLSITSGSPATAFSMASIVVM